MYFYVKNDKYPELLGVADISKIFPTPKSELDINHFAFLSSSQIDNLRLYCVTKINEGKPFLAWNYKGKQVYLVNLIGHTKSFDLIYSGYDYQKSTPFLCLKTNNHHIRSTGEEKFLHITFHIIKINQQPITIYYSNLDRNDFYQTPDKTIDFDLFETFLSMNAANYAKDYHLHKTQISVQWLMDEYFNLQPLFLDNTYKYTAIQWLKPEQQNEESVEILLNEYRLRQL